MKFGPKPLWIRYGPRDERPKGRRMIMLRYVAELMHDYIVGQMRWQES